MPMDAFFPNLVDVPVGELLADYRAAALDAADAWAEARAREDRKMELRAELAAVMLQDVLRGTPLSEWHELVASDLGYPGLDSPLLAEAIGRDVARWVKAAHLGVVPS